MTGEDDEVGTNDYTQLLQDQLTLVEALREVAVNSDEAETVRVAVAALTNTQAGLAHLRNHPIKM